MNYYSYPSIFNLGHKAVEGILDGEVIVQEKVDGSQFSVYKDETGLHCFSKRKELVLEAPEKIFVPAIQAFQNVQNLLQPGWIYRGEAFYRPKHNSLAYDRVPLNNVVIFDICKGQEDYLSYEELRTEAERLGFEAIPLLKVGRIESFEEIKAMLETTSFLGGQKIEGVVIKDYSKWSPEKKVLMAKYVSEAFKEKQKTEWKKSNPSSGDVIFNLIQMYKTEARWNKAIQHLRDDGALEESPRDIGKIMKEVKEDFEKECAEEVKDFLYNWASSKIKRAITGGLPEWYKEKLAEKAFE